MDVRSKAQYRYLGKIARGELRNPKIPRDEALRRVDGVTYRQWRDLPETTRSAVPAAQRRLF